MIKIYVWSDGTWCHAEDIEEYSWMSDDYTTLWVDNEADIAVVVDNFIKNEFLIEPRIAEPTPK